MDLPVLVSFKGIIEPFRMLRIPEATVSIEVSPLGTERIVRVVVVQVPLVFATIFIVVVISPARGTQNVITVFIDP